MSRADLTQAADLLKTTGAAIAAIGSAGFPPALAPVLRKVAPYIYIVVFGYRGMARPLDLYNDFPEGRHKVFVTDYQDGPYLLDPFHLAATRSVASGQPAHFVPRSGPLCQPILD